MQVALRWPVQRQGIVALSKTVCEARSRENPAIVDFQPSDKDMSIIPKLVAPSNCLPVAHS